MESINNHQFFTTVDELGLVFVYCNKLDDRSKHRLGELNRIGLKFVSSMNLRHERSDLPVVISIFEEKETI